MRFCLGCGTPLAEGAAPSARAPRDYTPKHLADKILQSKSALEGERKQVTVLFADVKSSMELQEGIDPEEWHRIMDRFFQILSEGVHRFEGTINQYTGDGIMALFGAPISHEDHAQRACYAALHLESELRKYSDELRRTRGLSFSVRMGLNSGDVVVGKIGDDLRMDYTAQGHTVGIAARVEDVAAPDRVYLAENTASLVKGYVELRDLGAFELKGVREPVRVHELQGVGQFGTRLDLSRARGFSRFVGRGQEMQILETALERAEDGNPQIVGIVADAGVGKSRLCFEFLERCRSRGIMIYETHGVAHGKNIPLLPMRRLTRGFYGITEQDSDVTAREKIAGRLLLLDERFREMLPLMFDAVGVPDPENPPPPMDPDIRQRQLISATKGVIEARAGRETSVTLLEDLHWFDGASEAFLEALLDATPGSRRLIILNFRPEYHTEWMQKSQYQQVPLLPLGPEALAELLRDLLGDDPTLVGLPALIQERTVGNPFFIEEVVRSLVESGHLEGSPGAYRLAIPIDEIAVPDTVHTVLAARIDRLAEREKQVLQAAAVIGKIFAEPILEQAVGLPKSDLVAAIHVLKNADFVYEQALYPVAEYTFKHPLTRDVAYDSQLQERRARIHAAVVGAIESLYPEQIDEHAALLAYHCEAAGEPLAAARWASRAAERIDQTHPSEAFRLWLKVRSLLHEVPGTAETAALGARACSQILSQGMMVGLPPEESAEVFEEGKELATLAGNPAQHAFLVYRYAVLRGFSEGVMEDWVELSRDALRLAREAGDSGVEFYIQMGLALALYSTGGLREALKVCDEGLARGIQDPHFASHLTGRSPYLHILLRRAEALRLMGRLREAGDVLERVIALSREHGYLDSLAMGLSERVLQATAIGAPGTALSDADEMFRLAEQSGTPIFTAMAYAAVGTAHIVAGDPDSVAELLEEQPALELTPTRGLRLTGMRSRLLLATGKLQEAHALLAQETAFLNERGARAEECLSQVALAEALRRSEGTGATERIRRALSRARELVEETEARLYTPQILEEEARLAELEGDEAEFKSKLREAHRLFSDMGATGHAERIARELDS